MELVIELLIVLMALLGVFAFLSGLIVLITGRRLAVYLRRNNHDRWAELTTISSGVGEFGPWVFDSIKVNKYINTEEDLKDDNIRRYKIACRRWQKAMATFIMLMLIVFMVFLAAIFLRPRI